MILFQAVDIHMPIAFLYESCYNVDNICRIICKLVKLILYLNCRKEMFGIIY
jgi:hypothetical protein